MTICTFARSSGNHANSRGAAKIRFWLRECRTPELLAELSQRDSAAARLLSGKRRLLAAARRGDLEGIETGLRVEEDRERRLDRVWWRPLRAELEQWRHARRLSDGQAAASMVPRRPS